MSSSSWPNQVRWDISRTFSSRLTGEVVSWLTMSHCDRTLERLGWRAPVRRLCLPAGWLQAGRRRRLRQAGRGIRIFLGTFKAPMGYYLDQFCCGLQLISAIPSLAQGRLGSQWARVLTCWQIFSPSAWRVRHSSNPASPSHCPFVRNEEFFVQSSRPCCCGRCCCCWHSCLRAPFKLLAACIEHSLATCSFQKGTGRFCRASTTLAPTEPANMRVIRAYLPAPTSK